MGAVAELLGRPPRSPGRVWTAKSPKGVDVTDEELADVNLIKELFHGEWNYAIAPRRRRDS